MNLYLACQSCGFLLTEGPWSFETNVPDEDRTDDLAHNEARLHQRHPGLDFDSLTDLGTTDLSRTASCSFCPVEVTDRAYLLAANAGT